MNYTTERTRRQIIQSFIRVLQMKRFSAITIQEICDDALIHRTTLFLPMNDKGFATE
jgi:AcrR family transcriptional regulator